MQKILIKREFKYDGIQVELKDNLLGDYNTYDSIFISKIKIPIQRFENRARNSEIVTRIKETIINTYKKGINDILSLNSYEKSIFYFIENIDFGNDFNDRVLLLGYKDFSLSDIKNTMLKFTNINCIDIDADKNIELMYPVEYEELYYIIEIGNFDKLVIDMPNLYLDSDYKRTKNIIKNYKDIIVLVNGNIDTNTDKFCSIFGEEYRNSIIPKKEFISPMFNMDDKIKSILKI